MRIVGVKAALIALLLGAIGGVKAAERPELRMPVADPRESIEISADSARHWRQGGYEVWLLKNCEARQGAHSVRGGDAVLWIDRAAAYAGKTSKVLAYFEAGDHGQVAISHRAARSHRATGEREQKMVDQTWFGRFHTTGDIEMRVPVASPEPNVLPSVFHRGMRAGPFRSLVQQAQFEQPDGEPASQQMTIGGRSINIRGRGNGRLQFSSRTDPDSNETALMVPSPVNIVLDDVFAENVGDLGAVSLGKIDIEADSVVIWTANVQDLDLFGDRAAVPRELPIEFYMEGNIVFRQGDTIIYAQRMYYNVNQRSGVILDAEMLTPVPEYEGLLRLKAEVLQQVDQQNYQAYNAALTSSRMGVPSYWLQSQNLELRDAQSPVVDPFSGQPVASPNSEFPEIEHDFLATSHNNFVYVGGVPVLYWPVIATNLKRPTYYIDNVDVKNDNIFGTQAFVDVDMYQLLGIRRPPPGSKWTMTPGYLSERGLALGTNVEYDGFGLWGIPGRYEGAIDAWGLRDRGLDNLGLDRMVVPPGQEYRGRALVQHRQQLPNGFQLTSELGYISDRNFLEQFLENEWDMFKDQTTGLEFKRYADNRSLAISTNSRLNKFFTQTEWLPRMDHFLIGQSILFDRLTWHSHTHVGYAKLETATLPPAGSEPPQSSLPWEVSGGAQFAQREGIRAASRQEIDLPLQLGPIKVTPYGLGEVGYWRNDLNDAEVTRLYGQAGVRTSMPIWRADPNVRNELFDLKGLAHKITLETEFLYADGDQDLSRMALYDPLDDDSQEHFIRRFIPTTFAGTLPAKYDSRFYALRSGLQSWVSSPAPEIADDLMLARAGVRQRWQTKRGLPGQERIVDWISFDVEGVYFPEGDRDNFGADSGLFDYDFRWHLGDRVTLLSDGFIDVFDDGLRAFTLGGMISRPERGSVYVGFRNIEGPVTSNVLTTALSYRLSEKWIVRAGTSFDFGPTGNIGQRLSAIRVGEWAFFRVGVNIDEGRDNVGFVFSIEPRLLPRSRLGEVGGVQIPPAGARGLQ